ncbi:hypothetical protein PVAND_016244 [Polypedilum vanderplanki]|uniref:Uncharacterized protein n=1 Tax=Polypedilum vanderplanki TaxID=319348 RepID=A0A9J6BEI5_POLVA|nr:hypothetical protein PVAND_016244 [Polypedilum vanderplanki]
MNRSIKKFLILFLHLHHLISAQPSPYSFKNQFIGNYSNYVTAEEELSRNYCNNYWCTNDAHYLFTKSSQYPNVNPCVDFRNFTVDQVVQVDVPDDRLSYRGFAGIVQAKYYERQRKVVAAKFDPIKDENSRIIKIVKNTFNQCLKSKHALRHIQAHKDIVEHLQSLGGSPYLSKHIHFNRDKFNEATDYGIDDLWTNNVPNSFNEDELWIGEDFNVSRYFEVEPWFSFLLFFDLEIKRCENDMVCLKDPVYNEYNFNSNEEDDFVNYKELLRTLDDAFRMRPQLRKILVDEVYWPVVKRIRIFLKKRVHLYNEFVNRPSKIKIKNLQQLNAEKLKIDWLQVINSQLFEESKLTENDEILVEGGIELLQQLVNNLIETDKKIIADTFTLGFIYSHRYQIILRFHSDQDVFVQGTKHGQQRWISCLYKNSFVHHMQPALLVMYEQNREVWDRTLGDFDRDSVDERIDIVGSAEKLIEEAVDEFKREFLAERAPYLPVEVAADILFKLKNLKILIGLPKSILPISKLEKFYKNLKLTGNETFLRSLWEIEKYHQKLRNEPKTSWRRQIDQVVDTEPLFIKYSLEDGNILFISPNEVIYPKYHPLRPRFFNMATLFREVLTRMYLDIRDYLRKRYFIYLNPLSKTIDQITYTNYKNWLKNNTDLQIGANYLTNEQLYWVAFAVSKFTRFRKNKPSSIYNRNLLNSEYLHVFVKSEKAFQDAFKCNWTENDENLRKEFLNKLQKLRN